MNKIFTIVIVILVIVATAAYFMSEDDANMDTMPEATPEQSQEQDSQNNQENTTEAETSASAGNTAPRNGVLLAPTETGMKATVGSAVLAQPGYVVVYRVNSQNETQVIGNTDLLSAGSYSNIVVDLEAGIVKDQTVVAVLHADDGDGEFEFPGSDGYLGDANQSIYSDVDIVDVDAADESAELAENVAEALIENQEE